MAIFNSWVVQKNPFFKAKPTFWQVSTSILIVISVLSLLVLLLVDPVFCCTSNLKFITFSQSRPPSIGLPWNALLSPHYHFSAVRSANSHGCWIPHSPGMSVKSTDFGSFIPMWHGYLPLRTAESEVTLMKTSVATAISRQFLIIAVFSSRAHRINVHTLSLPYTLCLRKKWLTLSLLITCCWILVNFDRF